MITKYLVSLFQSMLLASVTLTSAISNGPVFSFPLFLEKAFFNKNPYDLTFRNLKILCNLFNGLIIVGEQIANG